VLKVKQKDIDSPIHFYKIEGKFQAPPVGPKMTHKFVNKPKHLAVRLCLRAGPIKAENLT
jgi:hypothetical protein